jgi:Peroxiredoxin
MLNVGERAPDATIFDYDRKPVKLSQFFGKKNTVLAFYFLAFSPVCTNEMCTFDQGLKEFEKLDATVLGISVDSPFANKAFAEKYNIKYPLLSDFNKEAIKNYDVVHNEMFGFKEIGKRAVFIVDKNGIIRYKWVAEDPRNEPNYDEIRKVLQQLK